METNTEKPKKMVDVTINIDSLFLDHEETVDDVIAHIRKKYNFGYEPTWEIHYEEQTN